MTRIAKASTPAAGTTSHRNNRPSRAQQNEGAGENSSFANVLSRTARELDRSQARINGAVRRARRGHVHSQEELLALQATVYKYSQQLETATKLVDKASDAIKRTLQPQQ